YMYSDRKLLNGVQDEEDSPCLGRARCPFRRFLCRKRKQEGTGPCPLPRFVAREQAGLQHHRNYPEVESGTGCAKYRYEDAAPGLRDEPLVHAQHLLTARRTGFFQPDVDGRPPSLPAPCEGRRHRAKPRVLTRAWCRQFVSKLTCPLRQSARQHELCGCVARGL